MLSLCLLLLLLSSIHVLSQHPWEYDLILAGVSGHVVLQHVVQCDEIVLMGRDDLLLAGARGCGGGLVGLIGVDMADVPFLAGTI